MNKKVIISAVVSLVLFSGIIYLFTKDSSNSQEVNATTISKQQSNVEVRDGVQYVTVTAKGGYSPRVSTVQADIPTKLIMKTNGTYDCSSSLVIRSVGFQKVLEPEGETEIDLGILKTGQQIQGVCSMGMYSFQIKA